MPATKSILHLAKVLRLPRNSNLTKPSRGRANGLVSETVPRPFRDRLRTGVAAEVVCAQSGSPIHAQRQRFLHLAIPQLAESAAPATKSILDLAKVLRLPRNLNLTLRKCCACHAIQTLRNLRAAVPMGPSPNPFRTRSETVPRPFRDRLRTGVAAEVVCAQSSPIHAQRQRFLHLAIPQLAESACESAAPAVLEKAIYVLSWLYVKAIYLSCKPVRKLSICQASYMSKLSICHVKAIYLSCKPIGKLSICQASICQSYLFVIQAYWKAIYLSS